MVVQAGRERLAEEAAEELEDRVALELSRLDLIVEKLTPLLNQPGKAIRAGEVLKAVSESRRKLKGDDAPARHEHTGPKGAPIPVDARDALLQKLSSLVASTAVTGAESTDPEATQPAGG